MFCKIIKRFSRVLGGTKSSKPRISMHLSTMKSSKPAENHSMENELETTAYLDLASKWW